MWVVGYSVRGLRVEPWEQLAEIHHIYRKVDYVAPMWITRLSFCDTNYQTNDPQIPEFENLNSLEDLYQK